jgi:hypothetical protein
MLELYLAVWARSGALARYKINKKMSYFETIDSSYFEPIEKTPGALPPGGEPGEVLTKLTGDDYDADWLPGGGGGPGGATFTQNITVSLPNGKTFGKYVDGNTIVAIGKTANDVIIDACFNAKPPTLSFTPDIIPFGFSGSKILTSTFSYTINTNGASPALAKIEKANKSNPDIYSDADWSTPLLNKTTGFIGNSDNINQTDNISHTRYSLTPIYYRFTVEDSLGGKSVLLCTLTPSSYQAPTMSNTSIGEDKRYRGDAATVYEPASGSNITITKNSNYVRLRSYRFEKKINNNPWAIVGSSIAISDNNLGTAFTQSFGSISYSVLTTEDRNADQLSFRIVVVDEFNEYNLGLTPLPSTNLQTNLGEKTINFYHKCGIVFSTATSITISNIDAASGMVLQDGRARIINPVTAPSLNHFTYYVYKSSAGSLAGVIQDGAQPVRDAFVKLANLAGNNANTSAVEYAVYKSVDPGAFTNNKLDFS